MGNPTPPPKDVTFYDNYVPSLKPGEYTIGVAQSLTIDQDKTRQAGGNADFSPFDPVTQTFIVNGPRFVISPADIHRVFPPRNGTGVYHEYLPMVVLNKRALPWERQLRFRGSLNIQDPDKYPWMALLVFTDEELPVPVGAPPPHGQQNPTRSASFPLTEIVAGQSPGPPANVHGPEIHLQDDEDPAKICASVIDIPTDTFVNLVPSIRDLCFLAHVREASTDDKEPQSLKHDGWYSVVIANRFPTAPPKGSTAGQTKNVVHLVSLEGLKSLLDLDAPIKTEKPFVRMISLASWTCTCLQDPSENFRQLMLDLIGASSAKGTELLLRRPLADPGAPPAVGTVGLARDELNGAVSTIALADPAAAAVPAGTVIDIVAPDGARREQVTAAQPVTKGATSIAIAEHSFAKMPKASWVGPAGAFNSTTPAQRLRAMRAVAATAGALQGAVTSIPLVGPAGAYQSIDQGTALEIVDASGLIRQVITTSKATERSAPVLQIKRADFKTTMPAGSMIGPATAYRTLDRLSDGYVPLSYLTRSGEATFAWYRGPLAPVRTPDFLSGASPIAVPQTASAAMIYDPQTGLFDQSYAVALETGRSMALASKPFATALLQWRREAHRLVGLLLEYMRSPQTRRKLQADGILDMNGDLTGAGVSDLAALLDADLISDGFKDFLTTEFADGLAKRIGKAGGFTPADRTWMPAYPETPPPAVPADLHDLMQHSDVTAMLAHLSGLTSIGTTAAALSGKRTSIGLAGDGAGIALGVGTVIAVVSPDGHGKAAVRIAEASEAGAKALTIESFDFTPELPAGSRVLLGEASTDQIVQWLARAALLYGVPFNNLVPDERMLPEGSIRFFYLDGNWISCLLDGALSIAIQSSRDSLFQKLMRDPLHRMVDAVLHQVRERLRAVPATGAPPRLGALGGFVLRSQVISGWPGLEVRAWSAADADTPMKPLRLDRVAPSVMLGIFPDIPVKLEFNEPREGIVFGQEDEGVAVRFVPGMPGWTKDNLGQVTDAVEPIWLKPGDIPKRKQPTDNPALIVGGTHGLAQKLVTSFGEKAPTLTPASFAVQMVKVPEQMVFEPRQGGE